MFLYEVELVLSYFNLKLTQQRLEIEKLKLLAKKQEEKRRSDRVYQLLLKKIKEKKLKENKNGF